MDPNVIPPAECAGIDAVRAGMDALDREIVRLVAERVEYVRAAAKFKTSSASVADKERMAAVLRTRREWAEAVGLSGDGIEGIYRRAQTLGSDQPDGIAGRCGSGSPATANCPFGSSWFGRRCWGF
jgi:isochorismate pyruvate lyase